MVRRLNPSMRWTVCLRPPSTSVHLGQIIMGFRPNSSMRWTVCLRPAVHLCPSMKNFHGLSSEFVHEVDGLSSSGRPPLSIYGKFSWSVVQIRPRDGQSRKMAVKLKWKLQLLSKFVPSWIKWTFILLCK